jgi:hypothetical protein
MYTFSPIHLKDETKQNKDNKTTTKKKQDKLKGEKYLLMGALV